MSPSNREASIRNLDTGGNGAGEGPPGAKCKLRILQNSSVRSIRAVDDRRGYNSAQMRCFASNMMVNMLFYIIIFSLFPSLLEMTKK
jgi:hypothetical protein